MPDKQSESMRSVELLAKDRYRVELSRSGFWPCIVVCGDGTRELFRGSKKNCERVAAELTTAFLDGAFVSQEESHKGTSVTEEDIFSQLTT